MGRLSWLTATVVEKYPETERVSSIVFECPMWENHLAGQHVDIRLTAEDGYQAQRSYSIASAPEDDHLMLTVERLADGEISPYLVDELRVGDQVEMRGPIGGYFVWEPNLGGPLLMIAGGSGVVPFRSMLRHRVLAGSEAPAKLLYSSRTLDDVIYRDELSSLDREEGIDVRLTLTRGHPDDWGGYHRRVDREMLAEFGWPVSDHPMTYVCGPTGFVEAAATHVVESGHDAMSVKTERFGPTGT